MNTMNISLPDSLKSFVDEQVESRGYGTSSVGQLDDSDECREQDARVLYVGMTRAQECLLISTSADNEYSRWLKAVA
ncbi:MAG: hypothetical protein WDA11_11915 [Thiohalomonadaceae bacterium]